MTATRDDVRSTFLLELALDRAHLKKRFAALMLSGRTKRGYGDARKYPQPEMARELGVSLRQYQRWEDPDHPSMPTFPGVTKLCERLGVDTSILFTEPEPEPELEDKYELILGAIREQAQAEKQHHEQENQHNEQLEKRLRAIEAAFRTRRSRKAKKDEPTR